jgi:hypothetical protein
MRSVCTNDEDGTSEGSQTEEVAQLLTEAGEELLAEEAKELAEWVDFSLSGKAADLAG